MNWELHLVDSKNIYCDIFQRGTDKIIQVMKTSDLEETRQIALTILNALNYKNEKNNRILRNTNSSEMEEDR